MELRRIFCVIDPTTTEQPALNRAGLIGHTEAFVHAYVCVPPDTSRPGAEREEIQAADIRRHEDWLRALTEPLVAEGFHVTVEVECLDDWRAALAPAAERYGADLIIKSTYRHSALRRRLLKTSDWMLLRSAHCPVLFAKTARLDRIDRILAAINIAAEDEPHQALTGEVMAFGRLLADKAEAELHAVNAYSGSLNRIAPLELAREIGVDRARAHTGDASPDAFITETAEAIGAPLVIIGSVARTGLSSLIVGNTAERILDTVEADILTIIRRPEAGAVRAAAG